MMQMNSNWVLILLIGVAALAYFAGASQCQDARVIYRWLPRNLDEETDEGAQRVLQDMVAQDVVELAG